MSNNAHILHGLSAILNEENLRPGVNLKEIEQRMISGGFIEKVKDPKDKFSDELRQTASKVGINFSEFFGEKEPESDSEEDITPISRPIETPRFSRPPSPPPDDDEPAADNRDDDDDRNDRNDRSIAGTDNESLSSWRDWGSRRQSDPPATLDGYTREQERRAHISQVGSSMGADYEISLEREKKEDMKSAMLEEIDSLWSSLLEEEVDLSRISRPSQDATYEEVEVVLKMLRHKNDRSRYCSLAEEFLLYGAYGLEELFDGQRVWFGRYRPDLRGWHNSVNIKLRRVRHDTSTLVSGVMQNYNIGPGARLLLELIPNMLLHSKMRKQQYGSPGIYGDLGGDDELARATERIRGL